MRVRGESPGILSWLLLWRLKIERRRLRVGCMGSKTVSCCAVVSSRWLLWSWPCGLIVSSARAQAVITLASVDRMLETRCGFSKVGVVCMWTREWGC